MIYSVLILGLLCHFSHSLTAKTPVTSKSATSASSVQKLLQKGDWTAFKGQEKEKDIYYIVSFPIKKEGNYKKRGKPYLMITHRPADKSYNVVSFHAGYKLSKEIKPKVTVTIGKTTKEFELFVEGESAWTTSDEIDQELTKIIIKEADSLVISAESFKGTQTKDTYSLKGSLGTYQEICQKSGYKPKF